MRILIMGFNKFSISIVLLFFFTFPNSNAQYFEGKLKNGQIDAFKDEASRKTHNLSNYISIIADKSKNPEIRTKAMNLAIKLFIDENQIVQVSSKNNDYIKSFKIAEYLNRLRVLPYTKVEIQWYDINFIGEFKYGTDGKYYAVATIFQKFKGYSNEGKLIYEDITKKDIELVLDRHVKKIGDTEVKEWDVLLGQISVLETR